MSLPASLRLSRVLVRCAAEGWRAACGSGACWRPGGGWPAAGGAALRLPAPPAPGAPPTGASDATRELPPASASRRMYWLRTHAQVCCALSQRIQPGQQSRGAQPEVKPITAIRLDKARCTGRWVCGGRTSATRSTCSWHRSRLTCCNAVRLLPLCNCNSTCIVKPSVPQSVSWASRSWISGASVFALHVPVQPGMMSSKTYLCKHVAAPCGKPQQRHKLCCSVRPSNPTALLAGAAVGRTGAGWAVRSKAALLLALVAKRQGPTLWAEMLPRLVDAAQEGPLHAEMVCMALRRRASRRTPPAGRHAADEGALHAALLLRLSHACPAVTVCLLRTAACKVVVVRHACIHSFYPTHQGHACRLNIYFYIFPTIPIFFPVPQYARLHALKSPNGVPRRRRCAWCCASRPRR